MENVSIRYYADELQSDDHEETLNLLRRIFNEHGICVEIDRISNRYDDIEPFPGPVRDVDLTTVYERDFRNNRDLSTNIGEQPSSAFQTNSGKETFIGTVGIVDDDKLRWAAKQSGSPINSEETDGFSNNWSVEFLRNVAENGSVAVHNRYNNINKGSEQQVVEKFVKQSPIDGKCNLGVDVGSSLINDEHFPDYMPEFMQKMEASNAGREIDIVVESAAKDWVIEVKSEYTAGKFDKALGQALVSTKLYCESKGFTTNQVQTGIVIGSDPQNDLSTGQSAMFEHLAYLAKSLDIELFVREESSGQFRLYKLQNS